MTDLAHDELGALGHLLPDALMLVSRGGVVLEANAAAHRIFAAATGALEGQAIVELVAPTDGPSLLQFLRRCARSGSLVPGALRLREGDGEYKNYQIRGAALAGAAGPIVLLVRTRDSAVARFHLLTDKVGELAAEVSSRRRAELLLEHQLKILEHVVSAEPLEAILEQLVVLAERHGSPGLLASILLLDEDEKHLLYGAAQNLPAEYNAAIDGIAIGPNVGSCGTAAFSNTVVVARDIDSDPRWRDYKELALAHGLRSCWSTPIPSSKGSVLGTFALYYDTPTDPPAIDMQIVAIASRMASIAIERNREEAQIKSLLARERLARADAESANRAKDEFLALISHELRNPLNAILGWTRLLQVGSLDEETFAQAIETIERNVDLQSQLIEDVLDFSRTTSGQLKMSLKPGCIVEVATDALNSMRPNADSSAVQLELHADGVVVVDCDRARLHQCITNLISNAIKFTPEGGRITVRVEQCDGLARLTVSDTGEGIDADFLPHVFDPFRQADGSMSRSHSGLGLGLAVVRRITEQHGGQVSAHSAGKGAGSTFTIEMPLSVASIQEISDLQPRQSADLSGLNVLVVDDEADARELLGTILNRQGAQVTLVASAADATRALDASGPSAAGGVFDALISDIAMPDTDGYALIQMIRARNDQYASLPAAALTAHTRDSDRARALNAGFNRHLAKPVEPDQLLEVIHELTRGNLQPSLLGEFTPESTPEGT